MAAPRAMLREVLSAATPEDLEDEYSKSLARPKSLDEDAPTAGMGSLITMAHRIET
jgi:hypothetical protein